MCSSPDLPNWHVPANCHAQSKRLNSKTADDEDIACGSIGEENKRSQRQKASGWQYQESGVFHGVLLGLDRRRSANQSAMT
jgi:hypothetical protein